MNRVAASPATAPPPRAKFSSRARRSSFPWKRFWIQSLIAMLIFNVFAGLVTWYFIFPRLFPSAG